MIQFTQDEILHLREKKKINPQAVNRLKNEVSEWMDGPTPIPETGIGNWFHYYFCPKCSVQLNFSFQSPKHHICPVCGQDWTGSPYDETWWWIVSMKNHATSVKLGLLYRIEDDERYARRAIDMMLSYAKYYKDYEVHGDIPYNGPGKVGAQTLDEANFLRSFAIAYDLLDDAMTQEERNIIRDGMLLPGADFLMEHRHMQIHNHEVIINSAIAIIALIFNNEDYLQASVYGKYGILYQLEHGVQDNHMWFEGAFGYHFYALTSFFTYEKFALHTKHSQIYHPNYKAMMDLLFEYLEPGFKVPMLNDTNYGHTSSMYYLYEFAYRELGGERLLYVLNHLYQEEKRDNLEAFIYGVDSLPQSNLVIKENHVDYGPGNTIIRGANDRYLLFKHDRYGGEHDHYDRLDISYLAYGKRISPDLGTTGYGAPMHYDYYKNTASHNTINIGGANQSPANAYLTRYEQKNGILFLEAEVDWKAPYQMPDSFTIVAWNEKYYKNLKMKRKLAWTDQWFAEVTVVTGAPKEIPLDWVMHFSGNAEKTSQDGEEISCFSKNIPYKHLHDVKKYEAVKEGQSSFVTSYNDDGVITDVYGMQSGQTVFIAKGPNNPSTSDINYRVERINAPDFVFAHVISSTDKDRKIKDVQFVQKDGERVEFVITQDDGIIQKFTM